MELQNEYKLLDREACEEKLRNEKAIYLISKSKNLKSSAAKQSARIDDLEARVKAQAAKNAELRLNNAMKGNKRAHLAGAISQQECDIEAQKAYFDKIQEEFYSAALKFVNDNDDGGGKKEDFREVMELKRVEIDGNRRVIKEDEGRIEALEIVVDLQEKKLEMLHLMLSKLKTKQ